MINHCRHENSSGYYRVSAYFIAKIMCDLIPLRLIPLCLFTVIVYFMLGQSAVQLTVLP